MSAYSSIILLLILVFKWLQKLIFQSFEWYRTLKAIGFSILLPLYYLKKYQSEYEGTALLK